MRAATHNDLDDAWFAQPEDVIALIEDALPQVSAYRFWIYGLVAACAMMLCVVVAS